MEKNIFKLYLAYLTFFFLTSRTEMIQKNVSSLFRLIATVSFIAIIATCIIVIHNYFDKKYYLDGRGIPYQLFVETGTKNYLSNQKTRYDHPANHLPVAFTHHHNASFVTFTYEQIFTDNCYGCEHPQISFQKNRVYRFLDSYNSSASLPLQDLVLFFAKSCNQLSPKNAYCNFGRSNRTLPKTISWAIVQHHGK